MQSSSYSNRPLGLAACPRGLPSRPALAAYSPSAIRALLTRWLTRFALAHTFRIDSGTAAQR
eukprot:4506324-Pleurochrysis_carterae.AAC.1